MLESVSFYLERLHRHGGLNLCDCVWATLCAEWRRGSDLCGLLVDVVSACRVAAQRRDARDRRRRLSVYHELSRRRRLAQLPGHLLVMARHVRLLRAAAHRRPAAASSPYFCSRVAVGGGVASTWCGDWWRELSRCSCEAACCCGAVRRRSCWRTRDCEALGRTLWST